MAEVLIVDDDPFMLDLMQLWLEPLGHAVTLAADGEEATKLAGHAAIDLLITDLFMPKKEGTELVLEFRNSHPQAAIIAVSGHAEGSTHLKTARLLGATKILTKPLNQQDFLAAIAEVLG